MNHSTVMLQTSSPRSRPWHRRELIRRPAADRQGGDLRHQHHAIGHANPIGNELAEAGRLAADTLCIGKAVPGEIPEAERAMRPPRSGPETRYEARSARRWACASRA